jgi:catechol 2,3-dioxygenase-like lactoylglutathione lyase family enzyme
MIHHVAQRIPPNRLDAGQRFYELLGFVRQTEPPGIAGRAVWLGLGPTQIHLIPSDDGASEDSGHVAVVLARYEETVARLRHAGHELQPRRKHWGSPRCYVRDPGGNLVELMAWPPHADASVRDAPGTGAT